MADNNKYLNYDGLSHLVGKIKSELNKKADSSKVVELGEDGLIDSSLLPSYVDDVVEFSGIEDDATIKTESPTTLNGKVVYVTSKKKFVYCIQTNPLTPGTYYGNWTGISNYMSNGLDEGSVPVSGKIFVDTTTNKTYRWSGSELIEISSGGVTLGETSSTAYAGDKGAKNAADIAAIKNGDKPVCVPTITTGSIDQPSPWTLNKSDCVISSSGNNMVALAGSTATFTAMFTWKSDSTHKTPTECSGDFGTTLPTDGGKSNQITKNNINTNTTYSVTLKAPKEGLIVDNGTVKWASGSEKSTATASASISFQYKAVKAEVKEAVDASSLAALLADTSTSTWELTTTKAKTITNLTVASDKYYVYAYPKGLGALTKIVMNDATPLIDGGFDRTEVSVVEPRTGITIVYYVYTSVQKGAFTNAKLVME